MVLDQDDLPGVEPSLVALVIFELGDQREVTLELLEMLRRYNRWLRLVLLTRGNAPLVVTELVDRHGLDAHLPDYLDESQLHARLQAQIRTIHLQALAAQGRDGTGRSAHTSASMGREVMHQAMHAMHEAKQGAVQLRSSLSSCDVAVSRLLLSLIRGRFPGLGDREAQLASEDARLAHRLLGERDPDPGVTADGQIAGFLLSMGVRASRDVLGGLSDAATLDRHRGRVVAMLRLTFADCGPMHRVLELVTLAAEGETPMRLFADYCLLREHHAGGERAEYHALQQIVHDAGKRYSYDELMRLLDLVREMQRYDEPETVDVRVDRLEVGMCLVDGLRLRNGTRVVGAGERLDGRRLGDLRRLGDWLDPAMTVRILTVPPAQVGPPQE